MTTLFFHPSLFDMALSYSGCWEPGAELTIGERQTISLKLNSWNSRGSLYREYVYSDSVTWSDVVDMTSHLSHFCKYLQIGYYICLHYLTLMEVIYISVKRTLTNSAHTSMKYNILNL